MGMGIWSRRRTVVLVALGLALTTGCGPGTTDSGGAPAVSDPPPLSSPTPSAPEAIMTSTPDEPAPSLPAMPSDPSGADIVLVVGAEGSEQPPVVLGCDFTSGTISGDHPLAQQACADLLTALQVGDPFAPVPPDAMCTQQYGGDAVVRITGAVLAADGAPVDVDATFTLTDGCQISRFERLGAVLSPYRGTV